MLPWSPLRWRLFCLPCLIHHGVWRQVSDLMAYVSYGFFQTAFISFFFKKTTTLSFDSHDIRLNDLDLLLWKSFIDPWASASHSIKILTTDPQPPSLTLSQKWFQYPDSSIYQNHGYLVPWLPLFHRSCLSSYLSHLFPWSYLTCCHH